LTKSVLALTASFSTPNFSSAARRMPPTTVSMHKQRLWSTLNADDQFSDARGHYTIGKELVDSVIDRIRRVAGNIVS
jgi:hypothetical protein